MHKGLTNATLGVLGAALLSGSVFAAGPTLGDLPDLIITDRLKHEVIEQLGSDPDIYDDGTLLGSTNPTINSYRFTSAFDLANFVNYDDNGTTALAQVHYLWNEYPTQAAVDADTPTSSPTIHINGTGGSDTIPAYADIIASSKTVGVDGDLTFVDVEASGGDGTNPGPDPGANFTKEVFLEMYVASSDTTTGSAVDNSIFSVITTNDPDQFDVLGDALSGATGVTVELTEEVMGGWYQTKLSGLPDFTQPAPWDLNYETANSDATFVPANPTVPVTDFMDGTVNVTDETTPQLSISTVVNPGGSRAAQGFAPQYGEWGSWRRDLDDTTPGTNTYVEVTEGTLYAARWTVSGSPVQPYTTPDTRFRMGEATTYGLGSTASTMILNGANSIVENGEQHISFFYAHADGRMGLLFDIFDYYTGTDTDSVTAGIQPYFQGHSNYTVTVDRVEIASIDPASLSGGSVILNQGGAVTLASGEVAPPAGETAFDAANWTPVVSDFVAGDSRTFSTSLGSFLGLSLTAGDGGGLAKWDTLAYLQASDPDPANWTEILSGINNNELIRMDYYLSSPQGATADNDLPITRLAFQTDAWGESGSLAPIVTQGRFVAHTFVGWNRDYADVGETVSPLMALETGAKRYSLFVTPNLHGGASTIDGRPHFEIYAFPGVTAAAQPVHALNPEAFSAGEVRLHRVVVTKYPMPSGLRTAPADAP